MSSSMWGRVATWRLWWYNLNRGVGHDLRPFVADSVLGNFDLKLESWAPAALDSLTLHFHILKTNPVHGETIPEVVMTKRKHYTFHVFTSHRPP